MLNTTQFPYETRIAAFIDILGLSDHLLGSGGSKFAENVVTIISEALAKEVKLSVRLPHIKAKYKVQARFPGWHEERNDVDCRISSISDSIVISLPEMVIRHGTAQNRIFSILVCLETVFHLQRQLLQLGILTRGGISCGRLHHADNIVIGDALVSAYRLENQSAIFPRVIIAPSVQKIMLSEKRNIQGSSFQRERIAACFSQDHDGMYFVDYLGVDLLTQESDWAKRLRRIELFVRHELIEIQDLRIKQKFYWLRSYIANAKKHIRKDDKWLPHSTAGELENAYPRVLSRQKR
jgi:hypothetical protein